jgi:Predicted membrane protein
VKTRKVIFISLLSAIAVVLHIIESLLPLSLPLGVKLGFANIISLVVIERYGVKEMFIVNMMRVMLSGLLTGHIMSYPFYMSCGGVLLSSLSLWGISYFSLPIISKSIISAVFHNIGQLFVLMIFVSHYAIMSYLLIMLLSSIPTGILTGYCAIEILKRLKEEQFQ